MIRGLGPKKREMLKNIGIEEDKDLLFLYPRQYDDRSRKIRIRDAVDGENAFMTLTITSQPHTRYLRRGMRMTRAHATDGTDFITLVFFNQPYIANRLKMHTPYDVYGKIKRSGRGVELTNPVVENRGTEKMGRIVPVYPLTKGITQNDMLSFTGQAVALYAKDLPEILPQDLRDARGLIGLAEAVETMHRPASMDALRTAYQTLVYLEFFVFCAGMQMRKARNKTQHAPVIPAGDAEELLSSLPFRLTGAQRRALAEITEDMASGSPMNRLLQGDVGSGKTIVAFLAIYQAFLAGFQSVYMAPTEILARQHHASLMNLMRFRGLRQELLLGSTPQKERENMLRRLQNGATDVLISTHAALGEGVQFQNLGLAVTDEQHRFGVKQRAALSQKGENPHVLVMSATPIPRTLALLWYGDLEISTIDELPAGRIPIETIVITREQEARMAEFVNTNIDRGRQAFIICPLIEENEELALEAVETLYARISQTFFRHRRMDFLHGRLPAAEKEAIMRAFSEGKLDILVSTTVIEVGIDIPNANVMAIYNAERFGLAQLHQLRGRVGRGEHASYCILLNEGETEEAFERMRIMQSTNDGFVIASEDLKMRGAGELLGARQHGMPVFTIGDLHRDRSLFEQAKADAAELLGEDPKLDKHEHRWLRQRITEKFSEVGQDIILN